MFWLYLDDERPTPDEYSLRVYTASQAIKVLSSGVRLDVVSLDHDLGDDKAGTGYDVLLYIEYQVRTNPVYVLPEIRIHTANPAARKRMFAAKQSIEDYYEHNN